MCKSTGTSFGGNIGTRREFARFCTEGCTTWLSPSKTPSANIITVFIMVSFVVEIDSSTCGCVCSLPGLTSSEVCSWVFAGMTPIWELSASVPPPGRVDLPTWKKGQPFQFYDKLQLICKLFSVPSLVYYTQLYLGSIFWKCSFHLSSEAGPRELILATFNSSCGLTRRKGR